MSSHPSHSSSAWQPEAACESASAPDSAPGPALPRRPQAVRPVGAGQWVPPEPEVLQRVKAALARL